MNDLANQYHIQNFDEALQNAIMLGEVAPGEQQIDHYQTKDLYGRRCRIKAGTVGATLVHKHDHIAICLQGTVILVDQDGQRAEITAPDVVITKAGTQRAVLAVTDVDWITVHHTEHQDVNTIEDVLGCRSMREYQALITHEAA